MNTSATPTNVVLGAGAIGATIARQLAETGASIRVVSRSGRDLGVAGTTAVAGDITRPDVVRDLTDGAHTVYFAAQPEYTDWPKGFPPLIDGVIGGLRGTGIRLAVVDNLYGYGPTHGAPIREDLPLAATNRKGTARAKVAERLLAAHRAGDIAVTIARGSDYFGPGGIDSLVGDRFFEPILAGRKVQLIGDPDAPHTVTYIPDFARTLIELARHEEAFGEAWHVPSAPAVSMRRLAELTAEAAGMSPPRVSRVPRPMLRLVSLFSPPVREIMEMMYEFEEPYVMDDQKVRHAFGLIETPLADSLRATADWWRERSSATTARARSAGSTGAA